jgi:colicin import membrane protein
MNNRQSYKVPIVISAILHGVIFILIFLHFSPPKVQTKSNMQVVKAVAVNESQLPSKPVTTNKAMPEPIDGNAIRKIEQIALKQPQTPKTTRAEPLKSPQEVKPIEEEQLIRLQEPKLAQTPPKEQLAKQQQAELQERKAQEAKQLQRELAKEAKQFARQAIEEPTTPSTPEDNQALDEQINAEKKQLSSAKSSVAETGEIDKFKQMIVQAISRKWLISENINPDIACQLLVHVGPGGVVLNVEIIKESGDDNLDRSARSAIMKASPLPVPENEELFDKFRSLRLTFRPQGIVSG